MFFIYYSIGGREVVNKELKKEEKAGDFSPACAGHISILSLNLLATWFMASSTV